MSRVIWCLWAAGCGVVSEDDPATTDTSQTPTPTDPTPTGTPPTDTGPTDPATCEPGEPVGAGSGALEVTDEAIYCVLGVDTWDDLATKRRVTFVSDTYPWPTTGAESGDYRLPGCLERADGFRDLRTGTVQLSDAPYPGVDTSVELRQAAGDETVVIRVEHSGEGPVAVTRLDGTSTQKAGSTNLTIGLEICADGGGCERLDTCSSPDTPARETLTFARGEVSFDLVVIQDGGIWIDPPRLLVRAEGELDGEAWSQEDHFQLGYAYAAHGLDRRFVVRFAEPVGDGCGLVGTYGRDKEESLTLVDCDGAPIADLGPLDGP